MSGVDSTQDLSGRVVNSQFRLLRKLGRGGMGVVYLAEQIGMDRQVVVKVLHAELVAGSDTAGARFQREAKAVARLNHPHIVQVHVFGQMETGQPYLAMEYVEGHTLTDLMIGSGRLPEARALRIVEQVCDALVEAHGAGLVHRDLKPDNIMLADRHGNRDYVKVLDFGLAKMVDAEERAGVTHDGAIFGTPRYMSPEQGRGEKVDARTDLYALGVVLYEMLSGVHPFEARSTLDFLMKHASAPVVLPSARFPDLTLMPRVEQILKTCLAKDPADRFQSAAELRRVAREALRDLPDYARAAPTPAGPVAHRSKARRWLPAAVLVASFAVTLGVIALVARPRRADDRRGRVAAAPKDAGALTAPHAADAIARPPAPTPRRSAPPSTPASASTPRPGLSARWTPAAASTPPGPPARTPPAASTAAPSATSPRPSAPSPRRPPATACPTWRPPCPPPTMAASPPTSALRSRPSTPSSTPPRPRPRARR
ncbi:MAG: serine/threonine protein kinase [Myxococcales bacterium]|nr:serine/threonine protein kinase [Myxococcales bacterium]